MALTIAQYPTTSLPPKPTACLRNNSRINFNKTQHTLILAESCQQSNDFEKRLISKLRVKGIVDRIKPLLSNEKSAVITSWEHRGDFDTTSEFNDLLMALLVLDEPELALKLFDDMLSRSLVPDSWTFSISIRCHCKNKNFDEAERVLGHMLENGLHPNFASITILVNSLGNYGRIQRALNVLELMGGFGFRPRVQTYNCLLKGLCYVGRVEDAVDMLMGMMKKEEFEKPDIYSYTVVMNGLCKVGRTDEAFELLGEALEAGLMPDAVTFNTLFNGYCVEGRPMEGIDVLKMMKEKNCVPDYISYKTLLHGLLKWGHIKQALRVFDEMVEVGFKLEDKMVNTLVRGLCWQSQDGKTGNIDNAHRVFLKMKCDGYFIDPSTYDVMIQTLCEGKKTDEASVNFENMIRMGYSPRRVTSNGVLRALCVEGKLSEAVFVLTILSEGGRVPSRSCYNLLVHELNRQGRLLGACSVYAAALKLRIVPSEIPRQ